MKEYLLTNLATGEQHKFNQLLDVEHFLCRSREYVRSCIKNGFNCLDDKKNKYDVLVTGLKPHKYKNHIQPCCTCKNAYGGCEWSARFEPVPGWMAEKTILDSGAERYCESYRIDYCPKYEKG